MFFHGEYPVKMDAKGRVAVPAKIRQPLVSSCDEAESLMMMRHFTRPCLVLMPGQVWKEMATAVFKYPSVHKVAGSLQSIVGGATDCEVDGNGRMLISPTLRDYAQLDKDVIFLGQMDKFEIWDRKNFELKDLASPEEIADSEFAQITGLHF